MAQYINIRKSHSGLVDIGDCTICGATAVIANNNYHKCLRLKKKLTVTTDLVESEDIKLCSSYIEHARNANARKIPFLLTLRRFKKLMSTKYCFYTGVLLDNSIINSDLYPTLERLDSSIGYTDSNVVVVCARINNLKSNISIADIADIYKGLKRKKLV